MNLAKLIVDDWIPSNDRLLHVMRVADEVLDPEDDGSTDYYLYCKVEEMLACLRPIDFHTEPDWDRFESPSYEDFLDILTCIADEDYEATERLVIELARMVTVLR